MYFAAYLLYCGFYLSETENDGARCSFYFDDKNDQIPELQDEFEDKRARVEPIKFAIALKKIKQQVHKL